MHELPVPPVEVQDFHLNFFDITLYHSTLFQQVILLFGQQSSSDTCSLLMSPHADLKTFQQQYYNTCITDQTIFRMYDNKLPF